MATRVCFSEGDSDLPLMFLRYLLETFCMKEVSGCSVDDRLYMTHRLLTAVVTENVYDEVKDVANERRTSRWLNSVVDWLLSLQARS